MNFSREQCVNMIYVLGECDRNCLLASRCYAQKYPGERHPPAASFERLKERFETTGSVNYTKLMREQRVTNEENALMVVAAVVENPHQSTREISQQIVDMSHTSVHRILKSNKFHPYHIQKHQKLFPRDLENRMQFCEWVNNKEPDFLNCVVFTDEATFSNRGLPNRRNFHHYATEKPEFLRAVDHQHQWSINVWGGIVGTQVVGPHFFEHHLNGQIYLQFLEHELNNLLQHIPENVVPRLWYQHDGAPAHSTLNVRNCLDIRFPDRWIGRGGPQNWPARSPDLSLLDFFLWGFVKNSVYQTPPTTSADMKERIRDAFRQVTHDMLINVQHSFTERIQLCLQQNGDVFEHLL